MTTRHYLRQSTQQECEEQGGTWNDEDGTCRFEGKKKAGRSFGGSLQELIDSRNDIVGRLHAMLSNAEEEFKAGKREIDSLSAEEQANYDQLDADLNAKEKQIEDVQKTRERRTKVDEFVHELKTTATREPIRSDPSAGGDQYRKVIGEWFRTGNVNGVRVDALFGREARALQADSDPAGGYTIPLEQFVNELIQAVDDEGVIRPLSRTFTVAQAQQLTVPRRQSDLGAATWGSELQVATADTTLDFGKSALTPNAMTSRIAVSKDLYYQSTLDIEAYVRQRMAYQFAIAEETAFNEGPGSNRPLGVFIASADGISTGRDIVTSSSSGNITADNLINTLHSLKPGYRNRATWVLHRNRVRDVRLLKDANNQYLWTSGLGYTQTMAAGNAPSILDVPYRMSEYSPNTTASTTGTGANATGYTAIVGDFSNYWIADWPFGAQVQRLVELTAATNEDTYIGRLKTDGLPVLEEAFARARLST